MTPDDTLVIAFPRRFFAAGAALSAVAAVLSGWLAWQASGAPALAWAVFAAGWAAATALGAWGAVRVPALWRIGADGVAILGIGLLPWREIAAVVPRLMAVRIVPVAGAADGATPLRRLAMALRHIPGASPLHLGRSGLGIGVDDIRAAVERHAPGRWDAQPRPGT